MDAVVKTEFARDGRLPEGGETFVEDTRPEHKM